MDSAIPAAPGIGYQESRGLRLFRCEAQSATITDRACLANYRLAKSALKVNFRPSLHHCQGCHIGAAHCGEKPRARASTFCPRCHRSDLRFIPSSGLCVSCYNRQGEIKRGKNARGNVPVRLLEHKPVPHSIVFVHDGRMVRFDRLAVDSLELMLAAVFLARSPETLRFMFGRPDLEPVAETPIPDWQRNPKRERRELDDIQKQARASMRVGASGHV